MAARKKKFTHPLAEAGHSRRYLQNLCPFYLTSSSPPHLCAIKETGIQTLRRRFFRDSNLPSSRSAGIPHKVVFLASSPPLRFIGLSCSEQSELGLGNVGICSRAGCPTGPLGLIGSSGIFLYASLLQESRGSENISESRLPGTL